jgi:hypothetical protein
MIDRFGTYGFMFDLICAFPKYMWSGDLMNGVESVELNSETG